jgi:hypothetical protein
MCEYIAMRRPARSRKRCRRRLLRSDATCFFGRVGSSQGRRAGSVCSRTSGERAEQQEHLDARGTVAVRIAKAKPQRWHLGSRKVSSICMRWRYSCITRLARAGWMMALGTDRSMAFSPAGRVRAGLMSPGPRA